SRPVVDRQPARGRARHARLQPGAPTRAAAGPGHHPDRRAARRRDGADCAAGRRVRPPRPLDDAHGRRGRDGRPHGRVLPRREAADDPLDHGGRPARRHQPAPAAADRRRPRCRSRGDGDEQPHRRSHSRERDGGHPGRDRGRAVLRHAVVLARADRGRRLRRGRSGGRRERCDEPARLPRRARTRAQAEGCSGATSRRARRRACRGTEAAGGITGAGAGAARAAARGPGRLMNRLLLVAAAALALAAGTARADDGPVLGLTPSAAPSAAVSLPSAAAPNAPGSISVPVNFTSRPVRSQRLTVVQLQPLWQRAAAAYGVPWQVLAAINKIESNFGQNMGPSSAGAIGWMQFMPDTWLRWGVDADGNGIADPWNATDAIFAAARYLAAAGGAANIARAVFAYNHADWYVNEVLQLANVFAGGGVQQLDGMQQQL